MGRLCPEAVYFHASSNSSMNVVPRQWVDCDRAEVPRDYLRWQQGRSDSIIETLASFVSVAWPRQRGIQ